MGYLIAIAIIVILLLLFIVHQNKNIMALFDDILEDIQVMKDATENVAADLDRIANQIAGGLTKAQAETVATDLKAVAVRLKEVADKNPEEPEEPEEPPVEPPVEP